MAKGRAAFAPLDIRSHDDIRSMLGALSDSDQDHMVEAMETIQQVLGEHPGP